MTNFTPRLLGFFFWRSTATTEPNSYTLGLTIPYLKMYKVGRKQAGSQLQYFLTRSRNTFLVYISSVLKLSSIQNLKGFTN